MTHIHPHHPDARRAEARVDQLGLKLAARLSDSTAELPYDVSERLRAARVQALARRKRVASPAPAVWASGNAAVLSGDDAPSFWGRLASALPLVALVVGLVAINVVQNEDRARELAEVDTALLTDDLPPAAYADPGFVQFLRAGAERSSSKP
jgi:hypothetical protein